MHLLQSASDPIERRTSAALNHLPPDCRSHVFSFLSLFDCLRFGETSKSSLEKVIVEVDKRRYDQFLVRPYEQFTIKKYLDSPCAKLVSNKTETEKETEHPFLHHLVPEEDRIVEAKNFYVLPSVAERIEELYKTIPKSHNFLDDLESLIEDLKTTHPCEEHKKFHVDNESCVTIRSSLKDVLSSVTRAHQIHAMLLRKCTIFLGLCHEPIGKVHTARHTVTLEQYMGDVLSARCLVGNSFCAHRKDLEHFDTVSTGVEGGVTFDRWLDHLPTTETNDSTTILTATDWYKIWVFFHSTLLRISPFTVEQAVQLKLGPLSGILEPFDLPKTNPNTTAIIGYTDNETRNSNRNRNSNSNRNSNIYSNNTATGQKQQPRWFLPLRTYACRPTHDFLEKLKQKVFKGPHRNCLLQTTVYSFGPLGPAYRGRDRVETVSLIPICIFHALKDNIDNYNGYDESIVSLSQLLEGSVSPVMLWLKRLQHESQKLRPMTVQKPRVTIRTTSPIQLLR